MLYLQKSEKIEICTAPSCPLYRGLSAKLTGGCIDQQFFRKTIQLPICSNPQPPLRSGSPLWRGHEGVQRRFRA